ncbi:hypothetical protein AB0D42_07550 [Streptomyces sp. NPDC048304]|uniref:hypothetical protein n=1 Tax=Streptomyces sp. NPDC048304 TaxID=3154820 RepID=UPI0033E94DE0
MSRLHERSAHSQLPPGEQLLGYGSVVPAKSANGVGFGVTRAIGHQLVNAVGAQSGSAGTAPRSGRCRGPG